MADPTKYNMNNPSIKRIMREVKEMQNDVNPHYTAKPLEDNLFEWHFTIRGPPDSPFEKGIYHGRIILPSEYPFKPPNIVLLTPNGRFEVGKKICLSISAYHPEYWQPGWSIRTVLVALIGFMPTKGEGAIGALDYTAEERIAMAKQSLTWKCPQCDCQNSEVLPEETAEDRQKIQEQIVESQNQSNELKKEEKEEEKNSLELKTNGEIPDAGVIPPLAFTPPQTHAIPEERLESVARILSPKLYERRENMKLEEEEKIEVRRDDEQEEGNVLRNREKKEEKKEKTEEKEEKKVVLDERVTQIRKQLDIIINFVLLAIFVLLVRKLFTT